MDGGLTILKQLIDVFVDKITVYENEVVIAYNFLPQVNLPMIDEPARRRLKHFRAKENHPQYADDFGGEGGIRPAALGQCRRQPGELKIPPPEEFLPA